MDPYLTHQRVTLTDISIPVSLEESDRIKRPEFTATMGPPPPLDQITRVRLPAGNAIPALEDLLAGAVVPRGVKTGVVNPGSVRVVA